MTILIFVLVIVALIVVHEFGHFIAAKLSGMRVDEFGIGYPPRAYTLGVIGETRYSLNWIPFGGFVKIFGEDGSTGETSHTHSKDPRAFPNRPRALQALVLIAGVTMNLLFAYVLITGALVAGTPRALEPNELVSARDIELAIANVLPGSPADRAGLMAGDTIVSATTGVSEWHATDPESFTRYVSSTDGKPITLSIRHNGSASSLIATAAKGLIASDPNRYVLGVEVATIGVVPVSFLEAVPQGAVLTLEMIKLTAVGLWQFFASFFTFSANLSQVSGPVGIAGVVGSASEQGIGNLLSIMAVISINLALINLVPVPALDGGRFLFVIIESIIRRPIKPSVAQTINSIGFAFLILLMVIVTAHDLLRIIG